MLLRSRRARRLTGAVVAPVLLAAGLAAVPSTAATADPPSKVVGSSAAARSALADAQALFTPTRRVAPGHATRDATLTLNRLWQLRNELHGADRATADALFDRPLTTERACTENTCYHWNIGAADGAVPMADDNGNSRPDYVEHVIAAIERVRSIYVAAGYRAPRPDAGQGGSTKTDIYLADVGSQQMYGFCTSDMEVPDQPQTWDAWAYCVLDNDFSSDQFPTNTPLENLQVTAAHEYFHAVQLAYDAFEDSWFKEATATWVEDELYDDVDDNLQYLEQSSLARPGQPLDTFDPDAVPQYGNWIFFRFLTEQIDTAQGGLPTLVRDMWERADGAAGGPDDYSILAVKNVLAERGVELPVAFAAFATANRAPALWYEEGAVNHYPVAAPAGVFRLSTAEKDTRWLVTRPAHLASTTARLVPGKGLTASGWKLKVSLDLPPTRNGSAAVVTVYPRSGQPHLSMVTLDRNGDATKKVAFGSSRVKYVEVTVANASTRYRCWDGGAYSCNGTPLDDGPKFLLRATATK